MKWENPTNHLQRELTDPGVEADLPETGLRPTQNSADLENLIFRVIKRDKAAFLALYDRVSTPLYSLALTMLEKEEYASEVLQETFAWIWMNARKFQKHKGSAFSWLISLIRKRALIRIHQEGPSSTLIDYCAAVLQGHGTASEGPQTAWNPKVRQAFRSLSEDEQRVLKLAFFGGLNQQEIAEKINVPLDTIRKYAFEGIARLHTAITNSP